MTDQIPQESKEAITKAKEAAEAVELSRAKQLETMMDGVEERNVKTLSSVLTKVFGDFETSGRFIDLKKIPLICAQISQIHTDIGTTNKNVEAINDNIRWIVRIVMGAVVLGILALLFKS